MSNNQKSKVNGNKKSKSSKKLDKIRNSQFLRDEQETQETFQAIQLNQTQKNKTSAQQPHKLSWLLDLKQDQYLWGSDQVQKDLKGNRQMLEDFIKLTLKERNSILITLKIIIRTIRLKKESAAVYQIFLEQLKEKQEQRSPVPEKNLIQQKNKIWSTLFGKNCYIFITALLAVIIIFLKYDIDFTKWDGKKIGTFVLVLIWVVYSFSAYEYQSSKEKQEELRQQASIRKLEGMVDKLYEETMRLEKQRGGSQLAS